MNKIIKSNDWLILSSEDYNQFQYFIDQIKELDDSEDINHWVKWKSYDNQVVLQTRNFFFKIYKNDLLCGKFLTTLRKELSKNIHSSWYSVGYLYQKVRCLLSS